MAKTVSAKTLRNSFNQWFFWNGCSQQAETMLGMAFGQSMSPVIEELYDSKEDRAAALKRHITLFNTESQVGSVCNGIAIGMEEQLANGIGTPESIQEAKVALIGPTSAIGDSLWVATIIPLLLTISLTLSQSLTNAPWVGPVLYMLVYPWALISSAGRSSALVTKLVWKACSSSWQLVSLTRSWKLSQSLV